MSKRKSSQKYYSIIEAATKVFAKKGFFQAKISEIAKEAKVADGTIYIYFENKDDILISLFEEQMQIIIEEMTVQVSRYDDPSKKLEIFALTHLQMIEQNTDLAEIIQVEVRQSSKFMKEYNNEKFVQYLNIIEDIIKEGKEKGIFKKNVDPRVTKRAFFGALDEMSRVWVLSNRKKYDTKIAARQISEYFLNGIGIKNN